MCDQTIGAPLKFVEIIFKIFQFLGGVFCLILYLFIHLFC